MKKQEQFKRIDQEWKAIPGNVDFLLSEETIKTLQKICCMENPDGAYRTGDFLPEGPHHNPPKASDLDHFMGHFINQMKTSRIMFHPVEFAAIAYKRLLDISPFAAQNEPTAALFLNLLLSASGYPILPSPSTLGTEYEAAMEKAREMPFPDTDPLVSLIAASMEKIILKERKD
jgi:Fic family protein